MYGSLTAVILVLVAVLALVAVQPPPPTIAEFAPQAQEEVLEAPSEQSSAFGSGEGDCAPGTVCEAGDSGSGMGGPTPEPVRVPRTKSCIGDPPRQIEDPQSPPCVPPFTGPNGGETSMGVTAREVRIAIPHYDDNIHPHLQAFFNSRFELYGRRLNLINAPVRFGEAEARADANETYKRNVFASNFFEGNYDYYDELARLKIISAHIRPMFTRTFLQKHPHPHPYIWQYTMDTDTMFEMLGEWTCARLAHRKARHAGRSGAEDMSQSDRVFAIAFTDDFHEKSMSSEPLKQRLEACGASVPIVRHSPIDTTDMVLKMKEAGVTSVFCLCHALTLKGLGVSATSQGYFPEWLVSTYILLDANESVRTLGAPAEQRERLFGLSFIPKQVVSHNRPSEWAMREGGARLPQTGEKVDIQYRSLLLLASGIQMAGPDLTPQTFERGLHRTVFPNPDHFIQAGKVGFARGSHSMTLDAAEIWWSDQALSPYNDGPGAWCYVDGGVRHQRGAWPTDEDRFFEGTCDSGM